MAMTSRKRMSDRGGIKRIRRLNDNKKGERRTACGNGEEEQREKDLRAGEQRTKSLKRVKKPISYTTPGI